MRHHHPLALLLVVGASLVSCGSDDTTSPVDPTITSPTTADSPAVTTTPPTANAPATTTATTTTSTSTSTVPTGDQTPALWPPDGAETPDEAVAAFVREFFDVDANIGEFRAGDARSGEIDVFGSEEAGGVRATAFVRQLGPADAWFVIGAASAGVEITTPSTGAVVAADQLAVEGNGRGFESTINVRAVLVDADATELDSAIGAGGAFGDLAPWNVMLDLADARSGDTVVLVARGDTGLSNDPGEFTAIAVVIE